MIGKTVEATSRLRVAPGVSDVWSRFLIARLMWILLMAILVTATAGGFLVLQKPAYKSQATVAVYPQSGTGSAVQPFVMGTEKGVVSSGAVLSLASQSLLIPVATLERGLSVTVPADSDLLVISYTDANPQVAQSAAEAIAQAYVAYRTTALGPSGAKTGASTATLQAAVVTDATLPTSPDAPSPLLTMGIALIVGLSLGIGLALVLDWLDDAIRGPMDLHVQSNAPVLTRIPAFDRNKRAVQNGLIVVEHPDSAIAGAYRDLRTRVLQSALQRQARTLLVAAPGREDKSGVAANLAAAVALSGRRVIVLCADLCEGHTEALFGLEGRLGVTSVVAGAAKLTDALAHTQVRGLEVLSSGPATPDPSGVLQSRAFQVLLTKLRARADFVVIDAPPVLASPDTAALAESADMILLVGDARTSSRGEVRAAVQELQRVRDRLIGCVLDGVRGPVRLGVFSRRAAMTSDADIAVEGRGGEELPANAPNETDRIEIDGAQEVSSTNGHGDAGWTGDSLVTPDLIAAAAGPEAGVTASPASNGVAQTQVKTKRRRYHGGNEQ